MPPIDPSILLGIKPPPPLPTPDELATTQLKQAMTAAQIQQIRQNLQDKRENDQDTADIQDAISRNLGPDGLPDFGKTLPDLYGVSPRAAGKLQTGVTKLQKDQLDVDKLADEHKTAMISSSNGVLQGSTAENWPIRYPLLQSTNPQVAAMFSPQWDEQKTPAQIQAFGDAATSRKEFLDQQNKANDDLLAGKQDKYFAQRLLAYPNLTMDDVANEARNARDRHGVDAMTVAPYLQQTDPADPAGSVARVQAMARNMLVPEATKETLAETQARDKNTADNEAAMRRLTQQEQDLQVKWHATTDANEQARIRLEMQRVALERQRLAGEQGLNAPINPNAPHGDAFLATIPQQSAMVKSLAEGKQPWPSAFALRTPYWQDLMQKVFQYDPTFDTAQASNNARVKTRIDFTSGKSAQTINALNTVVGHVGNLAAIGDQLGNSSLDFVNAARNMVTPGGTVRGAAINNFNLAKQAVASELTRVYRQAGGSEKDIEGWQASINAAKSPAELQGAWKTIGGLLNSKLEAMQTQVDQGLGIGKIQIVTPEARQHLNRLEGNASAGAAISASKTLPGGVTVARQPDGTWKSPSGGVYTSPDGVSFTRVK